MKKLMAGSLLCLMVALVSFDAGAEDVDWPENSYLGGIPAITKHYTEAIESLKAEYKSFDYADPEQYAQAAEVAEEMEQTEARWKAEVERHVAEKALVDRELPVTGLDGRPYRAAKAVISGASNRQVGVDVTLTMVEDLSDGTRKESWLKRGFGRGYRGKTPEDKFSVYFMAVDSQGKPIPHSGCVAGAYATRSELLPGKEITAKIIWSLEDLLLMNDFAGIEEITKEFYYGK